MKRLRLSDFVICSKRFKLRSGIPMLHHGDNRGRHSANHNLLPDMHLRVRRTSYVIQDYKPSPLSSLRNG